jgi:hypothetical protein
MSHSKRFTRLNLEAGLTTPFTEMITSIPYRARMFVTIGHLYSSLICASKAGACPSEVSKDMPQALASKLD